MGTESKNIARSSTDMAKEVLRLRMPGYADQVINTLAVSGSKRADAIKTLTPLLGDKVVAEKAYEQAQEVMKQAGIRDKVRSKWLDRLGKLVPWPIRKLGGWVWRNKVPLGVTAVALGVGGYMAYQHWEYLIGLFPGLAKVKQYLMNLKGQIGTGLAKGKEAMKKGVDAGKDVFKKGAPAASDAAPAPHVPGAPAPMVPPPSIKLPGAPLDPADILRKADEIGR